MRFYLQFKNSNDRLQFETVGTSYQYHGNRDLLEYYVKKLDAENKNLFSLPKTVGACHSNVKLIDKHIPEVNSYLTYLTGVVIPKSTDLEDYLGPNVLNHLHALWVNAHSVKVDARRAGLTTMYSDDNMYPIFGDVVSKIGKAEHYSKLNYIIHTIENNYNNITCESSEWVEMHNPFPKEKCTNDIFNFSIKFMHCGRTLYNKFTVCDDNLDADDENTFNELYGYVEINFQRPQTLEYSKEYKAWCNNVGKVPTGDCLPIGNLIDYQNRLTEHKKTLYNNYKNSFSIGIE